MKMGSDEFFYTLGAAMLVGLFIACSYVIG